MSNEFNVIDKFLKESMILEEDKIITNLNEVIKKNNIEITDSLVQELLENSLMFNALISDLTRKYELEIALGYYGEIISSSLIKTAIKCYCELHDIKIGVITYNDNAYNTSAFKSYMNEIRKYPLLTDLEEKALVKKMMDGDMFARDILIKSNLKLVVKVALWYSKFPHTSLALMDLIQEGNMGLMHALEKYDLKKGCRVSTYAMNSIDSYIKAAIRDKDRTIRVPAGVMDLIKKVNKAREELIHMNGINPDVKDLALYLDMEEDKVRWLILLDIQPSSLNEVVYDDSKRVVEKEEFVPDTNNLEDIVYSDLLNYYIKDMVEKLDVKSVYKEMLIKYFGLFGVDARSPQKIGNEYNVSRQRVVYAINAVLSKIRYTRYISVLVDFLDYPEEGMEKIKEYHSLCRSRYDSIDKVLAKGKHE